MYKITLANGTVLHNIHVNGTTFIAPDDFDPSIMTEKNLAPTIIEKVGDDRDPYDTGMIVTGEHSNMRYYDAGGNLEDGYHFALADISKEELFQSKMYADIQYIAMMTDVDIL